MPLPGNRGCGSQYVREQFSKQVSACRSTLGRKASCMLIVIADADQLTIAQREQTLHAQLTQSVGPPVVPNEPIIILIPKWQVETWIKCLLGQVMSEDDPNTDRPPVDADQIRRAARTVFDWARPGASVGATCVPSLVTALLSWRRIVG